VLGMVWDAAVDEYTFIAKYDSPKSFFLKQKLPENPQWTKRLILRLSATVYDPLGLLAPFTVQARSLLQRLWRENLGWDDVIPENYLVEWNKWLENLFKMANHFRIPRWIGLKKNRLFTLHVFADASTQAFAACVFIRVFESKKFSDSRREDSLTNGPLVSLVTAKARVTPTKTESVSRLELAACCIAVRLGCVTARALGVSAKDIHYWTDSMNCLYWINSNASSLKTFVANRVGEIQRLSDIPQWRHVPTDQNPADIPTRFLRVEELGNNKLWWNGPDFLRKKEAEWPPKFVPPEKSSDECKEEFKKKCLMNKIEPVQNGLKEITKLSYFDWYRYSVGTLWDGYMKLLKKYALIFSQIRPDRSYADNFKSGQNLLIKRVQREDELLCETKRHLEEVNTQPHNKVRNLLPFIDGQGVLRSKTRLTEVSYLPQSTKYPIILTSKSNFTKLLVQSYHRTYGHTVGIQMVKSQIKKEYLILGLDNLLKSVQAQCMTCKIEKSKPLKQRIGDIPAFRLEHPLKAFAKVGLDFAGAFEIKHTAGRARIKSYLLVITCLQTRALHLEATAGMDMTAFMNAISRFISLRDMPVEFYSDNFKTFVSPEKELQNWVRSIDIEDVIRQHKAQVRWTFTPPRAAHFGGIYEIMVKATKRCLKAISNYKELNLDQFQTVAYYIANTLNSRPLTTVRSDESETMTLTPNHFLFGSLGGAVCTALEDNPKDRWHEVVRAVNLSWELFMREYIHELKKAKVWQEILPNVRKGDLVLELDPNLPRGVWKKARVETLIKSKDGLIRKVWILRNGKLYKRALAQLCPLHLNLDENPDPPIRDEDPDETEERPAEGEIESSEDSAPEA
jgi:hypothetical protein